MKKGGAWLLHGVKQGSEGEVSGDPSTKETPPPSCVLSEGGEGVLTENPSV